MPHPSDPDHHDSHYEDMAGKLIEFRHERRSLPTLTMRDDGPSNAFWAGPGPMPEALRAAGLIDPTEDDDDDDLP
jgi:hypothetical protein